MESLYIRVSKKEGENIRSRLVDSDILDRNLKIRSDGDDLLIPVIKHLEHFGEIRTGDFTVLEKEQNPEELLGYSPAYELVGDIAIIDRNEKDSQKIADTLVKQKKVKTVLKAETSVSGEYRIRDVLYLAGEKKTRTLYRENKCRYMIDLAKVYFTPRLATERQRIADQIKDGDLVVDMFAGIGPFSILIAKKHPKARVIAIDKNPEAIRYLIINMELNKVRNIEIIEGDVREEAKDISGGDHVIMNLPHSGFDFLEVSFKIVKKGGLIHFYSISHRDDLFDGTVEKVSIIADRSGVKIVPQDMRVVRPYAPYQYNICIEFKVI